MLTKNTISYLKSLQDKKGRNEANAFLVEGEKGIVEFLDSDFTFLEGYFSAGFIEKYAQKFDARKVLECNEQELNKISSLASNSVGVAVFAMRENKHIQSEGITLVLDGINDPGNLGTIIRTADWYGVKDIVASPNTVDMYNPKVIMATMGSFTRVNITYINLAEYLSQVQGNIYGAYLEGENIHTLASFPPSLHIVIGSESHGISAELEQFISHKVTIPRFGQAESLNAGVATAVILDNLSKK